MAGFFNAIREDVTHVLENDPAAKSKLEIVLCYAGLHALWCYRVNHWLWEHRWRLLARWLSQGARLLTLIEIQYVRHKNSKRHGSRPSFGSTPRSGTGGL